MNVTESRFKNRQLHMEDYLQMVSAEQKEYAEVFDYSKIAEKSGRRLSANGICGTERVCRSVRLL